MSKWVKLTDLFKLTDLSIWVNHVNGFAETLCWRGRAFQNNLSQRERVREDSGLSCAN